MFVLLFVHFFLRGFAKKTLLKTAKAAGLKSGKGRKQDKYVLGGMGAGGGNLVGRRGLGHTLYPGSNNVNNNSVSRASLFPSSSSLHHSNARVTMTLPQSPRQLDLSSEELQQDDDAQSEILGTGASLVKYWVYI